MAGCAVTARPTDADGFFPDQWPRSGQKGGAHPFLILPNASRNGITSGCDHIGQGCLAGASRANDGDQPRVKLDLGSDDPVRTNRPYR